MFKMLKALPLINLGFLFVGALALYFALETNAPVLYIVGILCATVGLSEKL